MEANKQNPLKIREKLLKALSTSSLHELTPDEILMALKEEGVESLEGLVTKLVEIIRESEKPGSQTPGGINLHLLSRQTPKELVSTIVHQVPKVPFILDGIEYDPKDIRRFDGRELHFVVGSQAVPNNALLAFEDRSILTNWLQIVYLSKVAGLNVARGLPFQSSDLGILDAVYAPGQPYTGPGRGGGVIYTPPLQGPASAPVEVTMYESVNFNGAALRLGPGSSWRNLTHLTRFKFLLWRYSWNDAISSIYQTSSLCAYWEHVDFQGAIRIVVPNNSIFDLDDIGFNDCISSVMNFG
jgi:hypothetical protein